ncbi:MAG: hypothetical protein EOT04_00920 [Candidatus Chaera renei]|uniref:Uncharacterized protein n=1 Tax=Candidatus Chaera renei TaxID=2506947 RepID=A0A4Q0AJ77_9BACT|nr:MAG: hypothetical protein EOT04_00920 [Candidatus Chaera renei]
MSHALNRIESIILKRRYAVLSGVSFLGALLVFGPLLAQSAGSTASLTEQKIATIRQNCVDAQSNLQRIQRSDVVARTNRGRSYEETLRLMAAFNGRLAYNKINEPRLNEIATELQKSFTTFYGNYTDYENTLEQVIKINCSEQPVSFYQQLVQARDKRKQLKNDVDAMQRLIDEYAARVATLKAKLQEPTAVPVQPPPVRSQP